MKKMIAIGVAFGLACTLVTGCTPGNNTGGATVAGATAGGLISAGLFGDKPGAIVAGALVGGIVGNQIGQKMDEQDKVNMSSAITTTPINSQATWTNTETKTTYTVTPTKQYQSPQGQYCREYSTYITVGGQEQKAHGTACRQLDGSWKVIS